MYHRVQASHTRGSPPSASFQRMKRQTWSFTPTRAAGGAPERGDPGPVEGAATPAPRAPRAAAEQRRGLRKGSGAGCRLCTQRKPPEPGPQQRAPAAGRRRPGPLRAPTVCIRSSRAEPATHRGNTFPAAGPAPAIPRRRFHSAFVRKPEDADAAEGLRRRPSDPERSGGAGRGPVLMLRAAREAKGEAGGR